MNESDQNSPLLTICIPTYNRSKYLLNLLTGLTENLLKKKSLSLEVLVVDNCSSDDTSKVTEKFKDSIRIFRRSEHLATAEENIIHSLDLCRGIYVWFLGDDDLIEYSRFIEFYDLLKKNCFDYILFNATYISGSPINEKKIFLIENDITEFSPGLFSLKNFGCLTLLAGISNQVMRKSLLSKEDGIRWLSVEKIYSHVFWIAECFTNSKGAFLNIPLIIIPRNEYGKHWEMVAERMNVWNHHFWTKGLENLISTYFSRNNIPLYEFSTFSDFSLWENKKYRILDEMVWHFLGQIDLGIRTQNSRQLISREDFLNFKDFILRSDPTYAQIFDLLKEILEKKRLKYYLFFKFAKKQLLDHISYRALSPYRIRNWGNYLVYQFPQNLVAIREDHADFIHTALGWFSPPENPPIVIVSDNLENLTMRINKLESKYYLVLGKLDKKNKSEHNFYLINLFLYLLKNIKKYILSLLIKWMRS